MSKELWGLDANALNDAAWEASNQYEAWAGETMSGRQFNGTKAFIAPIIRKYLESLEEAPPERD